MSVKGRWLSKDCKWMSVEGMMDVHERQVDF